MIYAIVTEYTDGHTATQFIDQKSATATREYASVTRFIEQNTMYVSYAKEIHPERKHHIVEEETISISLAGVIKSMLHNVTEADGVFTVDPVSHFAPLYPWY